MEEGARRRNIHHLYLGEKRPRAVPSVTKRIRPSKGPGCFGAVNLREPENPTTVQAKRRKATPWSFPA